MIKSFVGYHGTVASRAESIRVEGVQPSANHDDWLGDGAYFFVEGLNDPCGSAIDWAACAAWDKQERRFVEDQLALIEVVVTAPSERIFDLRELSNAREFHLLRRDWLSRKYAAGLVPTQRPGERTYDAEMLNHFKAERGAAILISNFHIQLSVRERYYRLDSRIPNVSVLCVSPVRDGSVHVDISRITIADRPTWAHEELL